MSVTTYIVTLKNSKFYTELLRILFCIIIIIQSLPITMSLSRSLSQRSQFFVRPYVQSGAATYPNTSIMSLSSYIFVDGVGIFPIYLYFFLLSSSRCTNADFLAAATQTAKNGLQTLYTDIARQ
jgi:hypothetical protein